MKILIIEDDQDLAEQLAWTIQDLGHDCSCVDSAEAALNMLEAAPVDFILCDIRLPGMSGIEFMRRLRDRNDTTIIAAMSGHADLPMAVEAMRLRAIDLLAKPFEPTALARLLQRATTMAAQTRPVTQRPHILEEQIQLLLPSDPSIIAETCRYVLSMAGPDISDALNRDIHVALTEALNNAIIHGNLGVSSALKSDASGWQAYQDRITARMQDPAFNTRTVTLRIIRKGDCLRLEVEDQGAGFDQGLLPDPNTPESLYAASGRGILMMNYCMDQVEFNERGNAVRMSKRV